MLIVPVALLLIVILIVAFSRTNMSVVLTVIFVLNLFTINDASPSLIFILELLYAAIILYVPGFT